MSLSDYVDLLHAYVGIKEDNSGYEDAIEW